MMKSPSHGFRKIQTHCLCFEALHKLAPSIPLWLPFFFLLCISSEPTTISHFWFLEVQLAPTSGSLHVLAPLLGYCCPNTNSSSALRGDLASSTNALGLGQPWLGYPLCSFRLIQLSPCLSSCYCPHQPVRCSSTGIASYPWSHHPAPCRVPGRHSANLSVDQIRGAKCRNSVSPSPSLRVYHRPDSVFP